MPINHPVKQGECISSIAFQYGFFPETIWDDPANAALKEQRKNPNVLQEGDVVVVPDLAAREEPCSPGQPHKFKLKGVPEQLRLRLRGPFGEPRKDLPYKLTLGLIVREGTTDADGVLTEKIPPDAVDAVLLLGEGDAQERMQFALGHLDPIEEIKGYQARLKAVGCDAGPIDGIAGKLTKAGIEQFQRRSALEPTGTMDDATRDALKEAYGC